LTRGTPLLPHSDPLYAALTRWGSSSLTTLAALDSVTAL